MNARRVSDIGEFGLIALLTKALPDAVRARPELALGIGDDAAVWRPTPGASIVVTTDSLVEGIHFRPEWTDWASLGHKALAVNISDLAAMAAAPKLAVVTLGLRGDESVDDLITLYQGLGLLAKRFEMAVAGGDIVRSPTALTLHVTALGEISDDRLLTRAGAQPGDVIGVTGTLGASAAGLRLLGLEANDARRQATTADLLIQAHLRPEPRVAMGKTLRDLGATAAMDLSDGLLGDLPKILAGSGVTAEIDARRVPVAAAARALFPESWLELALRGGEDYELLFTIPSAAWPAVEAAVAEQGGQVTAVGSILPAPHGAATLELIGLDGSRERATPGAFDHFGDTG